MWVRGEREEVELVRAAVSLLVGVAAALPILAVAACRGEPPTAGPTAAPTIISSSTPTGPGPAGDCGEGDLRYEWAQVLGGTEGDTPSAVAFDVTGRDLVLVASSDSPEFGGLVPDLAQGAAQIAVARVWPDGALKWLALLGGGTRAGGRPEVEWSTSLAVSGDGAIYVGGYSDSASIEGQATAGKADGLVYKLGPDGAVEWARLLGGAGIDHVWAVAVAEDGGVYAAGDTASDAIAGVATHGGKDLFLARLAPDGNLLWTAVDGSDADEWAEGAAAGGGQIYVVGSAVASYSPAGDPNWTRQLSDYRAQGALARPDGGVVVAGTAYEGYPDIAYTRVHLEAYDAAGGLTWETALEDQGFSPLRGPSLAWRDNGDLLVAATIHASGGSAGGIVLAALAPDGRERSRVSWDAYGAYVVGLATSGNTAYMLLGTELEPSCLPVRGEKDVTLIAVSLPIP